MGEFSRQRQKETCREFCAKNQWGTPSFYEKSSKGKIDVSHLIQDIKDGRVDVLIANMLPVISRNSMELMELKRVIYEYGVQFVIINGNVNTLLDTESAALDLIFRKEVA